MYNRFYLNPHITGELSGSRLFYNYRGERLTIALDTNLYSVSNKRFTISSKNDFGFFSAGDTVIFFHKGNSAYSLKAVAKNKHSLHLQIIQCNSKEVVWKQRSPDASFTAAYSISQLLPLHSYLIYGDGVLLKKNKTDGKGNLNFQQSIANKEIKIVKE